jgi:hypothetical protein
MSHEHEDIQIEPVPGLPEELPEGERILWQASPRWRELAVSTFKLQWFALYFAAMVAARGAFTLSSTGSVAEATFAALMVIPLALLGLGLIAGFAWLNARASLYTITNRRIVMRLGVALPVTFNLPFAHLASAQLKEGRKGHGQIAITLDDTKRLAWAHLWPHVRPWRIKRAAPVLLAVENVRHVAAVLAQAVSAQAASSPERAAELGDAFNSHGRPSDLGEAAMPLPPPALSLQGQGARA